MRLPASFAANASPVSDAKEAALSPWSAVTAWRWTTTNRSNLASMRAISLACRLGTSSVLSSASAASARSRLAGERCEQLGAALRRRQLGGVVVERPADRVRLLAPRSEGHACLAVLRLLIRRRPLDGGERCVRAARRPGERERADSEPGEREQRRGQEDANPQVRPQGTHLPLIGAREGPLRGSAHPLSERRGARFPAPLGNTSVSGVVTRRRR